MRRIEQVPEYISGYLQDLANFLVSLRNGSRAQVTATINTFSRFKLASFNSFGAIASMCTRFMILPLRASDDEVARLIAMS